MRFYGTAQRWTSGPEGSPPRGDVHAIDGNGEAACGLKGLAVLHTPPRTWRSEPSLRHCPVCVAALAAEADLGPEVRGTPTNRPR
jgi:hypothetical protein